MSGYAVVQWNWGNGLSFSTVPEKWIISVNDKLKCYFSKSKNAAKAVKEQHDVSADWQLFDVRKLSSKSIKDYDTALSKEKKLVLLLRWIQTATVNQVQNSQKLTKPGIKDDQTIWMPTLMEMKKLLWVSCILFYCKICFNSWVYFASL